MGLNKATPDLFESLMNAFVALTPEERRADIVRANRYLTTETGRREFGLPVADDDRERHDAPC